MPPALALCFSLCFLSRFTYLLTCLLAYSPPFFNLQNFLTLLLLLLRLLIEYPLRFLRERLLHWHFSVAQLLLYCFPRLLASCGGSASFSTFSSFVFSVSSSTYPIPKTHRPNPLKVGMTSQNPRTRKACVTPTQTISMPWTSHDLVLDAFVR